MTDRAMAIRMAGRRPDIGRCRRLATITCALLATACSLTSAQTARPPGDPPVSDTQPALKDAARPSAMPSPWRSPRAAPSGPLSPPEMPPTASTSVPARLAQASTPLQGPTPTGMATASPTAPWVRIPTPGADELWYDREKMVIAGREVTYWRRVNFAVPQQFKTLQVRTALYREQINCEEHTLRVHAQIFQSADGVVVEQVNHSAPDALFIVPDTVGDALWRTLCPMVAQHRMADERLRTAQERLDNRRKELERLRVEVEDLEAAVARLRFETLKPTSDAVRDMTRDAPSQPGRQGS